MRSRTLYLASLLTIIFLVLLVAATLATQGTRASPGILYVSTSGSDAFNCTPDPEACRTVQRAINLATTGDEIHVATGTYTDTAGTVVEITETITLQGGWSTDFTACDPDLYPTTLDAQGQGRVVQITGIISPTIDGFTITGGNADDETLAPGRGGGIYSASADPIIQNNVITNNIAYMGDTPWGLGGGIFMSNASPSAIITGNTIISNTASTTHHGLGGGLCFFWAAPRVIRNRIINNAGNWGGGGIAVDDSDGVILSGNEIISNTTSRTDTGHGGGVYIEDTSPFTLTNNVIAQNYANTDGGGLYLTVDPCNGELANNTFAQNNLGPGGDAIYSRTSSPVTLTNNIIVTHTYGIYVYWDCTVTADYTLFYGNANDTGGPGTLNSTHEVIGDPLFVDPSAWDHHIQVASAAIDAGSAIPWLATDIDGDPRPLGTGYDIGADESPIWYIYLPLIMKNY